MLIPRSVIDQTVARMAEEITADYRGKQLVAVGILKGAFIFMADLVRRLDIPMEVDFITVSSYGSGTESSRIINVRQDLTTDIRGKDILVIEDIVDSGRTVCYVLQHLSSRGAASVRLCALADKPSRREVNVKLDYLGFTVPDRFVVGYGLDFDNKFRYLPDIYALENDGSKS
ncbi:MAG: hypoxanthine phosphoribosyltransferase [Dehalococcoidia bacterium]|nr:hypoxanthine phosphoribosyltransferase [Dehalococcoidia bacterium]